MKISLSPVFSFGVILSFLFLMNSCGGSDQNAASGNETAAEAVDDGQGVGRFKNITLGELNAQTALEGKAIFDLKCAACHKITDQKVVGPGMKGITERRKPAWILNMITNPVEMTQKDPVAKELFALHLVQMTFQDVSDDQAVLILEYLRQNDAGTEVSAKN